ncbi:hypothetical protein [Allochromatium tepidum]|uniref:Immunity protein 30 domain-containing protein n=1 Tax=Allochromatium tepidum TaxID=553982 RepID=A0ABM7QIN9_9GAMM|nr:hypothetical protein [Allochromatium tepidum]BCU05588.1 hypothetical protein Atep_02650 [Allochromatium tepidum]
MSTEDRLNMAFRQFLSSSVSDELLRLIKDSIGPEDVDTLMQAVLSLNDPSEYCKHDLDSETVSGFFLFLDFISALIIQLGDQAIQATKAYQDTRHPFVPWVIKFVNDERFHAEILAKFESLWNDSV